MRNKEASTRLSKACNNRHSAETESPFFKYSDRRTSIITDLTGGVGGICKLLKNYHDDVTTKFKAPEPRHPVIVLIDNDSGANSIYEAIAGITKAKRPEGHADFIHVTANLYVVPTPFGPKKRPHQ